MNPAALGLAASLTLCLTAECLADDLKITERFTNTVVGFELKGPYDNVTLTITGPNDFNARAFSKSGAPSIDLRRAGALQDGTYAYQLTAASPEKIRRNVALDDGRGTRTAPEQRKSVAASGTFRVRGGAIVKRETPATLRRRDQN